MGVPTWNATQNSTNIAAFDVDMTAQRRLRQRRLGTQKRSNIANQSFSRWNRALYLLVGLWLLLVILQFSGKWFLSWHKCDCKNGKASRNFCHNSQPELCAECNDGYVLSPQDGGGFSDNMGSSCRPKVCICPGGEPTVGLACPVHGKTSCASCNTGFVRSPLIRGFICHAATGNVDVTRVGESSPDLAGKTGNVDATRVGESSSDLSGKTGNVDVTRVGESSSDLAGNIGIARSTAIVRSEGDKDQNCADEFIEAFDQARGRLDFAKLGISDPGLARRAGACIGKSTRVKVLDISCKYVSQAACSQHFLRGLEGTQALESLESLDASDPALWAAGDTRFVESIVSRLPRLSELNVRDSNLDVDSANRILSPQESLESLDISGNDFHFGNLRLLGHTLSRLPRLSNLNLARNRLDARMAEELLMPMESLQSLDISFNNINPPLFSLRWWAKLPSLSKLNLADNHLNANTAYNILSTLEPLESLDISGNMITNTFYPYIIQNNLWRIGYALSMWPRLFLINLGRNQFSESKIGEMFPPTSPLLSLRRLFLPRNHLSDIAGFGSTLAAAMPALEELDVSSNKITGPSVMKFISALPTNSSLHVLDLSENCISRDMHVNIKAVAKRLTMLRIRGLGQQRNEISCGLPV